MLEKHYCSSNELIYNPSFEAMLSPYDFNKFLEYKKSLLNQKDNQLMVKLNLETFNEAPLFFSKAFELKFKEHSYLKAVLDDFAQNESYLFTRNFNDITLSRIYSEVEGTLNIESVPTTRRAVEDLAKGKRDPQNRNDQIIKNMLDGMTYVAHLPAFNEKNLYSLYNMLSKDCLDEEDKLLEGHIYRHDGVEVGGYHGCPVNQIKKCMDSLFKFVNDNLSNNYMKYYLPHICHYYIAYIHPYFDYNGRTARMVSYWISLLTLRGKLPPLVSEAINQTKSDYYNALSETRDSNNDLTYFFIYIFDISIKYFNAYKTIEKVSQDLMNNKLVVLSPTQKAYFKKILISNRGKFTHNEFTKWIGVEMSKQGALKILNEFESYGLLKSEMSQSNNKLFEIVNNQR